MKYILILITITPFIATGQVIIGTSTSTSTSTSVILDFDNNENNVKGIILPAVDNLFESLAIDSNENNGTFLLDKSDSRVKMYENNTWVDLSSFGNTIQTQTNPSEEIGEGVIIGNIITKSKGVLILESLDKALVLPKIFKPDINVKSPYPGMICYDTYSKSLTIFDGEYWSYWK